MLCGPCCIADSIPTERLNNLPKISTDIMFLTEHRMSNLMILPKGGYYLHIQILNLMTLPNCLAQGARMIFLQTSNPVRIEINIAVKSITNQILNPDFFTRIYR